MAHDKFVPWDEDRTKMGRQLLLLADSWKPPELFPFPEPSRFTERAIVSPGGTIAYNHIRLPKGRSLRLWQGKRRGHAYFDRDVEVPQILKCWNGRPDDVWMSYTPMEVITQRPGIRFARGTVVLGGLGMGWLLNKVCAKESVERVIVVEKNRDLLDWFGSKLCAAQPKVSDVICADVREHYGKHGDARYLIDIWEGYGGNVGYNEREAMKAGCKMWCWGGVEHW